MKTISKLFAALVILTFASVNVNAQDDASATANAAATILTPIAITKNVDMNFGNIAAGSLAGTVVLGTNGTRVASNVILPTGVTGTVSAAEFTVTGLTDATYVITLPLLPIDLSGPGEIMTIVSFVENANNSLSGGEETFQVGATLNVGALQAAGEYTGEFEVTVAYN